MVDPSAKGTTFPPFQYVVPRNKVRELLLAIGDENSDYDGDDPPLPPTFPTLLAFWGGPGLAEVLKTFGVDMWNVLHAEQEYEYLAPVHIGDTVTGRVRIEDVYAKGGRSGSMTFIEIITDFENQDGEAVLKERSLIIVRDGDE